MFTGTIVSKSIEQMKVRHQQWMNGWFFFSIIDMAVVLLWTLSPKKRISSDLKFNLHFFDVAQTRWSSKRDLCDHYYNFNRCARELELKWEWVMGKFLYICSLFRMRNFVDVMALIRYKKGPFLWKLSTCKSIWSSINNRYNFVKIHLFASSNMTTKQQEYKAAFSVV